MHGVVFLLVLPEMEFIPGVVAFHFGATLVEDRRLSATTFGDGVDGGPRRCCSAISIFFFLHDLNLCGGVPDRVFLLLVMIFICSLEVLVRGYKCKRAIQTATVWLVGVQVP